MSEQLTLVVSLACQPHRYRLYPSPEAARAAVGQQASKHSGVTLVLPLDGPLDLTFMVEAIAEAETVLNDYPKARTKGYLPAAQKAVNSAADQLRRWAGFPKQMEAKHEKAS